MIEEIWERRHYLRVFAGPEEMGEAGAEDVSQAMRRFIQEKSRVNMVFAAAPSQNQFLASLSRKGNLDWSKVVAFHLDEYVDLPRGHLHTFEAYLKEHLVDLVKPGEVYFIKAMKGNPQHICREYSRIIVEKGGIDIACIGIGENGHIAFNEPGSSFTDPQMVRVVTINEVSVKQQFKDYKDDPDPAKRYASLEDVPRQAITLTIPAILSSREIYVVVPGPQKAEAVRKMWEGPVEESCPASSLRTHPRVRFYLDRDSSSSLRIIQPLKTYMLK